MLFTTSTGILKSGGLLTCFTPTGRTTISCWGNTVTIPYKPNQTHSITAMGVGEAHTCIIVHIELTHLLNCWGSNTHGQTDVPEGFMQGLTQVDAGQAHTCVINGSRLVNCWGTMVVSNNHANMQDVAEQKNTWFKPDQLIEESIAGIAARGSAIMVSAGFRHNCVISKYNNESIGMVNCWGLNNQGQCDVPAEVRATGDYKDLRASAKQIAAGAGHTCAIILMGKIVCWGWDLQGELNVPKAQKNRASAVSLGVRHTCGVRNSFRGGHAECWGHAKYGQSDWQMPAEVEGKVKDVAAGQRHSCLMVEGDRLVCYGADDKRQCIVPEEFQIVLNKDVSVDNDNDGQNLVVDNGKDRKEESDVMNRKD